MLYLRDAGRVYDPLAEKVVQRALAAQRTRPAGGSLADVVFGFLVASLTVMFLLAERTRNAGRYTIADVLAFRPRGSSDRTCSLRIADLTRRAAARPRG